MIRNIKYVSISIFSLFTDVGEHTTSLLQIVNDVMLKQHKDNESVDIEDAVDLYKDDLECAQLIDQELFRWYGPK